MLRHPSHRRLQVETLEGRRVLSANGFTGGVFIVPVSPMAADDVVVDGRIITAENTYNIDVGAPGGHVKVFDGVTNDAAEGGTLIPVKVKHNL